MIDIICCGAINWDINLFMERLPKIGEEVPIREIERVSGGTAANVAVTTARILGPNRVAFIGALGEDEIAKTQMKILMDEGVNTSGILFVPEEESGQAYICIGSNGENEIHTYFGANLLMTSEDLEKSERLDLIKGAKIAVIMDPPLEVADSMAKLCRENGATVLWDPGIYTNLGLEVLIPTLRNTDYFVLNHLEFENLLGTSNPQLVGERLNEVVKDLNSIIKLGANGCALFDGGSKTTIQINAVPLDRMGLQVVNTVGCGDALIGGFAAAKVMDLDDTIALRYGCAAGGFKATRKETRGGPTADELEKFLERWESI